MAPKYAEWWGGTGGTPLRWTYCWGENCAKDWFWVLMEVRCRKAPL